MQGEASAAPVRATVGNGRRMRAKRGRHDSTHTERKGGAVQADGARATQAKSGKEDVDEPYVMLITNVEYDFARLHQAALQSYCMLDPGAQRDAGRASTTGKGATDGTQDGEPRCVYDLHCRTETRSAELCVYGTPGAAAATIFAHRPTPVRRGKATGAELQAKAKGSTRVEAADDAPSPTTPDGGRAFGSLQHMVSVLRHKPYFGFPPKMYVHEQVRCGAAAGSDGCQSRLVTALAMTSAPLTVKQLRHHLRDLKGFASCWSVRPRQFRTVFQDRNDLFEAKRLLDQFELDNHVRVSLRLSDTLTRAYDAFVNAHDYVENVEAEQ